MEKTNPFENPVSKDAFNGFWIPHHNAKVMKRGLEENRAPFLPDPSGNIQTMPIYNMATGYCLPANRLIPAQFSKLENGFSSDVVVPRTLIGAMDNSIKENEKGIFYNFKDEQGEIHVASYFFPEQTVNPDSLLSEAQDKLHRIDNLKDISLTIASADPKEYLASYIAACRSGMKLSVDPVIAEEFKKKIMPTLENDIAGPDKRDKSIQSLSNLLFEADKRGTEICKTLSNENQKPAIQKQAKAEVEMMF